MVADKTIIKVAKRNIDKFDIVPLYYNMRKASPSELNNKTIYDGLNAAFTGGNIGIYSNNISKIWNNDVFVRGTKQEKQHAINCIKRLCCQNNFVIDYAKTLYKPEFPEEISNEIREFTNKDLPHFFKYAKDKEDEQVEAVNDSFVNKLNGIICNPRINYRYIENGTKKCKLDKPDYTLLMNNPDIDVPIVMANNGKLIEGTHPVVLKYIEEAKMYGQKMSEVTIKNVPKDVVTKTQMRKETLYSSIVNEVRFELSQFGQSNVEVADILVKYLYGVKENKRKELLWTCYGEEILNNLKKNIKPQNKAVQCVDCGEWFEVPRDSKKVRCDECISEQVKKTRCIDCGKLIDVDIFDSATCRCGDCVTIHKRELARLRKQKQREKQKSGMSRDPLPLM